MTSPELAWLRFTVNSTPSPSSASASSMLTVGVPSSSTMVPVAVFALPSAAFADGLASVTVNVSSFSSVASGVVGIVNVPCVVPAPRVSVRPLAAV